MPVAPVQIEEVGNGTLPQPVDDVSKSTADDQRQPGPFQWVPGAERQHRDSHGDAAGEGGHQKRPARHQFAKQSEAGTRVETERQVDTREHGDRFAERQSRKSEGLCDLVGQHRQEDPGKDARSAHDVPLGRNPNQRGTETR